MRAVFFFLTATLTIAGQFTTSIGDTYPYTISAITTDSAGNTYIVGSRQLGGGATFSLINGTLGAISFSSSGGSDVFLTKLDPTGKLLFTDTFAGKGVDTGTAIALDPSGNIYIAGATTSNDFPLTNAIQTQPSTYGTGFIIKVTNDGSTILYSTYFGGTLGATSISSLATDSKGNLYLTGTTTAADFPHTAGMPFTTPVSITYSGVILASISADGEKILYSGALFAGPIPYSAGLTMSTGGVAVAVDAAGNAYFAGNVGIAPNTAGSYTGILARVNAAGAAVSDLTYLPTSSPPSPSTPSETPSSVSTPTTAPTRPSKYRSRNSIPPPPPPGSTILEAWPLKSTPLPSTGTEMFGQPVQPLPPHFRMSTDGPLAPNFWSA